MMIWESVVHVQLFICKTEIAEIFRAKCLFVNGSGCEGDECLMQAEQDSEYDDSEVE